jgi:hypothetical protein
VSQGIAVVEHGKEMLETTSVDTVDALDALLDHLATESPSDEPWMANIMRRNGDTLTIGLGVPILVDIAGNRIDSRPSAPVTVLSFVPASGDPPYYASRGPRMLSNNVVFFMAGQWSEFQAGQAIPVSLAREAVRQFVTAAALPTAVDWEEV